METCRVLLEVLFLAHEIKMKTCVLHWGKSLKGKVLLCWHCQFQANTFQCITVRAQQNFLSFIDIFLSVFMVFQFLPYLTALHEVNPWYTASEQNHLWASDIIAI